MPLFKSSFTQPISKKNIVIIIIDALRPKNLSLFGYGKETDKNIKEIANDIKSNQIDFFKLNELKTELKNFIASNKLPNKLVEDSAHWIIFIELLLEILKECPIVFNHGKIERLSLDEDKKGYVYYRFRLRNNRNIVKIKLKIK